MGIIIDFGVIRSKVNFWVSRLKVKVKFCTLYKTLCAEYRLQLTFLPNHFQTSHANCGWGTLLILGLGVKKVSVNFGTVFKTLWTWYRLQFLPNHFQTSHVHCSWWKEEPYWFWVVGSKVNFGTLCIKRCGHDTDYSFCPITFKHQMQVVDDERRIPIDFGSSGQRSRGQRSRSTLTLCVIKPCGHDTDYSFCPITFKLQMQVVDDESRKPIDFGSQGQSSTLALCMKPYGHKTEYSFRLITFKLHMYIVHYERRNPIDFGSRGQRSRSTLALCA